MARRTSLDSAQIFIEDGIFLEDRIIHLFGEIDETSVGKVVKGIQLMVSKNKEAPIDIYLNSMGGEIYSGLALFDFIQGLSVQVTIYVVGAAMSAASIVLMAGDVRVMYPNAKLMLHTCSGGVDGKSFEIINDAEEHKRIHKQMAEIYGARSHVRSEKWAKDLKHEDMFLRADKALELGLIDKILEK